PWESESFRHDAHDQPGPFEDGPRNVDDLTDEAGVGTILARPQLMPEYDGRGIRENAIFRYERSPEVRTHTQQVEELGRHRDRLDRPVHERLAARFKPAGRAYPRAAREKRSGGKSFVQAGRLLPREANAA